MEVPRKKARTRSNRATTPAAASQQIAELQAELERCKREKLAIEERHDQEVQDLRRWCAVNARTIQVLKKDVKWRFSAPNIPRSHWADQGRNDQYIADMTTLGKQIRRATEKLRNGAGNEKIPVCLGSSSFQAPLEHDDALLPYWSELSDAIQLRGEGDYVIFYLHHVQVNRSVIEMLSRSLALKCEEAFLIGNHFADQDGVNLAIEAITNNPQMKTFRFEKNPFESEESASKLCRSILLHPKISIAIIQSCCNEGASYGYDMVKTLLSNPAKTFKEIYLGGNHIRSNGCRILPDYIASNPPLEILSLYDNHLVDDDLRRISTALKTNNCLKKLSLGKNDYSSVGIGCLAAAVMGLVPCPTAPDSFHNPDFNSSFGCNHTCRIHGVEGHSLSTANSLPTPSDNKFWKLYNLFHWHATGPVRPPRRGERVARRLPGPARGELVKELRRLAGENLTILVPFILQRIGMVYSRLPDAKTHYYSLPASIQFDLLRTMPELFEPDTKEDV